MNKEEKCGCFSHLEVIHYKKNLTAHNSTGNVQIELQTIHNVSLINNGLRWENMVSSSNWDSSAFKSQGLFFPINKIKQIAYLNKYTESNIIDWRSSRTQVRTV